MYSAKIFLAFEAILDCDLIFLYSSHASQNSRFSSLNSVRRKALKAARPSEGESGRREEEEEEEEDKQEESWLECHGNLTAEVLIGVSAPKIAPLTAFLSHVLGIKWEIKRRPQNAAAQIHVC